MEISKSKDILIKKLLSFCAYQDRSVLEARKKLEKLEAEPILIEEIVEYLKSEKFLDDERFAISFTRGKFFLKKWGRVKILHGLSAHNLEASVVERALKEIPEKTYLKTLDGLLKQKKGLIKDRGPVAINKVYRFGISKGYESNLISKLIGEMNWD